MGVKVKAVAPNEVSEDAFGGGIGLRLPADDEKIRAAAVAFGVVGFAVDGGEEGSNVLNLVVDGFFEGCAVPAKGDWGEVDQQVGSGDGGGNLVVVIGGVALTGTAYPAEEIASAVANFVFAQGVGLF